MPAQDVYETARTEFQQLGIGLRRINALVAAGIRNLNDLRAISESELAQIPGIGPLAVKDLKKYLSKHNSYMNENDSRLMSVTFADEILDAIDKWALEQKGVASRADAVRRLVEFGLGSEQGG